MASRLNFENSNEIGCYLKLTNTYCLVAESASNAFQDTIDKEMEYSLPIIPVTIGGMSLVGRMVVGNKNGLLVPSCTNDYEYENLLNYMPESVEIMKVDERLSALGNVIACNDYVAIANPEVSEETIEQIERVLGVEVLKTSIAGNTLVGSYTVLTNRGGLVHPMVGVKELETLTNFTQIPMISGTVNRGSDIISGGLVVNDLYGFCGQDTTASELSLADAIFRLNDTTKRCFAQETQVAQIMDELY